MSQAKECLPIPHVLEAVRRVEKDVVAFYKSALEMCSAPDARELFETLIKDKEQSHPELERVCREIECGDTSLENATEEDINYLSALAEAAFYRRAGNPAELADPSLQVQHLVENALRLERNLILFYTKLFGASCTAHQPIFSKQLQMAQRHAGQLSSLRQRLSSRL